MRTVQLKHCLCTFAGVVSSPFSPSLCWRTAMLLSTNDPTDDGEVFSRPSCEWCGSSKISCELSQEEFKRSSIDGFSSFGCIAVHIAGPDGTYLRLLDVKGSGDEVSNGDGNAKGGFCDVETASDGSSKLIVGAAGFNAGAVVVETSDGSTRLIVGTWRLTGDAAEFGIGAGWLKKNVGYLPRRPVPLRSPSLFGYSSWFELADFLSSLLLSYVSLCTSFHSLPPITFYLVRRRRFFCFIFTGI